MLKITNSAYPKNYKQNQLAHTRLTVRLRLEPIDSNRENDLYILHQDEGISAWYGVWTKETAKKESNTIGKAWKEPNGIHKWMVYDKVSAEIIGRGGLSRTILEGKEEIEIGWALRKKYWGKGYATEIGMLGIEVGFNELGAKRIVSFTEVENIKSRAVMERLGFEYVKDFFYNNIPFSLYVLTCEKIEKLKKLKK